MTKKVNVKNQGNNVTEDFDFPPINIEEIDRAIFNFFDKDINFGVTYNGKSSKVPVVFAAGERFALTRRKSPIRDKNNALILPIISIMRTGMDISPSQNNKGTAISFYYTQPYYIKRRLADQDRDYQNIVNKMGLKNQDNVTARGHFIDNSISPGSVARPSTFASRRNKKGLSYIDRLPKGIKDNIDDNIFEIIEVPYPDFISMTYNVTFWTQYVTQANQIIETLMSKFMPYKEAIITTANGYEVFISLGDSINSDVNFENYTDDERVIKHSIDIVVSGYLLALDNELLGIPFRSYFSAPQIDFGYYDSNTQVVKREKNDFERLDDKKLVLTDLTDASNVRGDELERGQSSEEYEKVIENPFNDSKEKTYVKAKLRNQRAGETVAGKNTVRLIDTQSE